MRDLRDLASWTAMVSCFANNDMGTEAIVTFLQTITLLQFGAATISKLNFYYIIYII